VSEDTIAKMQDLIRGTGSEKRVYIPSLKKEVIIKKLSIGEIADIYKGTKDDFERVLFMLWKGLVEPKPKSFSEVRQLDSAIATEIVSEIGKLSGTMEETRRDIQNLSLDQKDITSS